MKTWIWTMLVVGVLSIPSETFAQRVTPPANVPPNPNWVVTNWGEPPAGKDWKTSLRSVCSVNYDPHGKGSIVVLVSPVDRADPAVWVFDYDGHFQKAWGANMFTRPYDLVVDRFGYLWIADEMENFVAKFTEDGKLVMMVGKRGVAGDNTSHDLFNGPTDVAVAKNGDFFVTDGYKNSRVVKFDKKGKFLMMIGGTKGSEIGQFSLPHRVFIDSKGELVIQDRENRRIQFWTQDGKFIKQWTDLGFLYPAGMAILPDDTLYVSDSDGQSIKIIKDDKIIDAIGGLDRMRPHQVSVDRFGALYISDEPDKMVKKIVRKSTLNSELTGQP